MTGHVGKHEATEPFVPEVVRVKAEQELRRRNESWLLGQTVQVLHNGDVYIIRAASTWSELTLSVLTVEVSHECR